MTTTTTAPVELDLAERAVFRRAAEAVIWAMPVVNYRLMYEAGRRAGGPGDNRIVVWSNLLDWRNQTLTPNPDLIYGMAFVTTKDGPMVLEIPPADDGVLNATIMTSWQVPLEDVGPAGADEGRGGRYLILPPGYAGDLPDGYVPLRSDTYQCFSLLRSVPRGGSDADVAKAVAYIKRVRLYPLAQADKPPETAWVDASAEVFDATIPYDHRFFRVLADVVQVEPFLHRDRAMIDPLRTIGIERGKQFDPAERTRSVLTAAATEAHNWLDDYYLSSYVPFADGSRWSLPIRVEFEHAKEASFELTDAYPVDARASFFTFAFSSIKRLGAGQFYLCTVADAEGRPLDGAETYRLHLPPGVPVSQYWSVTVYDRDTHTLLRGAGRSGRSSNSPELQTNADGSIDLYFGPEPADGHDGNWTPTNRDRRFELMCRFYGPTPALFDKTWTLPDVESTKG